MYLCLPSHAALAIPQIKKYGRPLLSGSKVDHTPELLERGDRLVTPYTAHTDTPTQTQNGGKRREETQADSHYEFDNDVFQNGNAHPPSTTPKSLMAHVQLTNRNSTVSPGTTPKVPLLPPTPKQTKKVRMQNSPKAINSHNKNTTRQLDPPHGSKLRLTSPLPRFLRPPVPIKPRPKSHDLNHPHYEVAEGCQTLPPHYASVRGNKPSALLKKTTHDKPPISHHYEVANNIGTTPPDYATPTTNGKVIHLALQKQQMQFD